MIDNQSRYLPALALCPAQTPADPWAAPWAAFGDAGLPRSVLSDNGFAPRGPAAGGRPWREARLVRPGVRASRGRPSHPQTQGKGERLHGTLEREPLPRRDGSRSGAAAAVAVGRWRGEVSNAVRPHEAPGHAPSAWYASRRPRPARRPPVRPGRTGERRWAVGRCVGGGTS